MGSSFEVRRRLTVISAWFKSRSQRLIGKSGSTPAITAMRCEVCFEGTDHAFDNVAPVHVRRDSLVLAFPFVGDVGDVCGITFVVKYIQLNCDASRLEALHDSVVGWDPMCVRFLFECLDRDGVGAKVMS